MTLYELTNELQELLALAEDPEMDPQMIADTLEGLEGEIELKAEGYGKVIAQMKSEKEQTTWRGNLTSWIKC